MLIVSASKANVIHKVFPLAAVNNAVVIAHTELNDSITELQSLEQVRLTESALKDTKLDCIAVDKVNRLISVISCSFLVNGAVSLGSVNSIVITLATSNNFNVRLIC